MTKQLPPQQLETLEELKAQEDAKRKKVRWTKVIIDVVCFAFLFLVMYLALGKPVKISWLCVGVCLVFRYIIYKNDALLSIEDIKETGKVSQKFIAVAADIGYITFLYLGFFYYNI